jgi:hypothetical protein
LILSCSIIDLLLLKWPSNSGEASMHRTSTQPKIRGQQPVGAVRLQAPAATPAKPLDFLFLGGGADSARLTATWRRSAARGNLRSKRLLTDDMQGRNSASCGARA